jgi:hypothetical protein
MEYKQLNEKLGAKQRKKLANHTYAERRDGGAIAIKLHDTDILTFKPREVAVTSGGWKRSTTKARINEFLPGGFQIYQGNGIWVWSGTMPHQTNGDYMFNDGDKLYVGKGNVWKIKFADGMSFVEAKKLRKEINDYAKLCVAAIPMPKPSMADCWHCCMKSTDGKSMGGTDHLRSHMSAEEKYVVPSLIVNAQKYCLKNRMKWNNKEDEAKADQGNNNILATCFQQDAPVPDFWVNVARRECKNWVRRYLCHQFGLPVH